MTSSASRCDRCGDVQHDIDVGFSLAAQKLRHGECGGTYRRYTPEAAHGRESNQVTRQPPNIMGLDDVWCRIVQIEGTPVLELRDPDSGPGGDPETKPRHQYRVIRGVLFSRRLPPESVGDTWRDTGVPSWEQYSLPPGAMPDGPVRDYYRWITA